MLGASWLLQSPYEQLIGTEAKVRHDLEATFAEDFRAPNIDLLTDSVDLLFAFMEITHGSSWKIPPLLQQHLQSFRGIAFPP